MALKWEEWVLLRMGKASSSDFKDDPWVTTVILNYHKQAGVLAHRSAPGHQAAIIRIRDYLRSTGGGDWDEM